MKQFRWWLQIRFKDNGDPSFMKAWDINEPLSNLKECEEMAESLLDNTVESMRIVDSAKQVIYKQIK